MATINYSITASSGNNWTGTFDVDITGDQAILATYVNVTAGSFSIPNSGLNFKYYPASTGDNYITWRNYGGASQYPDGGYSLDIWSLSLYTDIITNTYTWDQIISAPAYSLNSNKTTVFYDYNTPYAPYWCKGGTIDFT